MTGKAAEPIEAILFEIESALRLKLYYLAIASSLTVPDICVTLSTQKRKAEPLPYAQWSNDWFVTTLNAHAMAAIPDDARAYITKPIFDENSVPGEALYKLRCAALHNAMFERDDMQKFGFERFLFSTPETGINIIGRQSAGGSNDPPEGRPVMWLDTKRFVLAMTDAARRWYAANSSDDVVIEGLDKLVRYREKGMPPWAIDTQMIG